MAGVEQLIALFRDPSINEFIVNADGSVYVESGGGELTLQPFKAAPEDVAAFLSGIVGADERFGPQRPYADLSAQDGSRVHVIVPPLVRGGPCVTIRKRPQKRRTLDEMISLGQLPESCAAFLRYAVGAHKNMLIAGGTSSGKTTLINALSSLFDPKERIIVLEDTLELALPQPHVAYLKTRARDAAGLPDVTLRDLVANTLRMRPDRIVVGEVRGVEAADLLEAMNVGHEGVMCTLHANSSREALQRLETLVMASGTSMPIKAIRSNMTLAIDLIVFMARLADGGRRVCQVTEVTGMEGEIITLSDLFIADTRKTGAGMSLELKPTGAIPKFYDQLRKQGANPPIEFFRAA